MHDLGIVAAELKHYFARHKGNGWRAEPYIGHKSIINWKWMSTTIPWFNFVSSNNYWISFSRHANVFEHEVLPLNLLDQVHIDHHALIYS